MNMKSCENSLPGFLKRYLPRFYRQEQRELAQIVLNGKLSTLERKTLKPIAQAAARESKPLQHFVGAGRWDNEAMMVELRRHVSEDVGNSQGIFLVSGEAFVKKGSESCGVARQRYVPSGPAENCQIGVFLDYASPQGCAPLDRRLYLPPTWIGDARRREKCQVPEYVKYQAGWQIALELIERSRDVPHGWVVADEEIGQVAEFRKQLHSRRRRYVVDISQDTLVREITGSDSPLALERAEDWALRQPASHWRTLASWPGSQDSTRVQFIQTRVRTQELQEAGDPEQTLLVTRFADKDKPTLYRLSNASADVTSWQLARIAATRDPLLDLMQEGRKDVGLGHYEVRSWIGWHHHMTLSLLALWFLLRQRWRGGPQSFVSGHLALTRDHSPATETNDNSPLFEHAFPAIT